MCLQVLAPGLRIGWVTAAPKLVERIIYHMQGIHLGANSFTQASAWPLSRNCSSRLAISQPYQSHRTMQHVLAVSVRRSQSAQQGC